MARITVEDCEKVIENRFDLVILAAERARQIFAGDKITIDEKKDEKKSVIALREIAEGNVSAEKLKEKVIDRFRAFSFEEDFEEDLEELTEEDTYSPYAGIEMKSLESDNVSVVEDIQIEEQNDIEE